MNTLPFIVYCAVVAAAVIAMAVGYAVRMLRVRLSQNRDATLRVKYLRIVMLALTGGAEQTPSFPLLGRSGTRLLLCQTLAGVVGVTYGLDMEPLRRIVARYGLDEWLLRRADRTWGYRRARLLALLAQLPIAAQVAARVGPYMSSRNRYVRFYALAAQLAADPGTALRLMGDYAYPFSACEVAEIMALLRRGMLPIAYEPLMTSANRNLRMVGLGVVRQFSIEQAERQLLRIVASDSSHELGREALHTLCSLRRPLARKEVAARIARMTSAERRSLLRNMALEGYAPEELRRIFDERERPYYQSLVQSYKRCLA